MCDERQGYIKVCDEEQGYMYKGGGCSVYCERHVEVIWEVQSFHGSSDKCKK